MEPSCAIADNGDDVTAAGWIADDSIAVGVVLGVFVVDCEHPKMSNNAICYLLLKETLISLNPTKL